MKLNLGIKIRELRRRDGRTQEALAEALGVTGQAVSRWESGGSYPDMEILPSIANYFGVTIDELFGYSNNREKKIAIIIEKADKEICTIGNTFEQGNGDISECVEMLRAASEEFSNEPQILLRLGDALHMLGWQKNGASEKPMNLPINKILLFCAKKCYCQELASAKKVKNSKANVFLRFFKNFILLFQIPLFLKLPSTAQNTKKLFSYLS